MNVLLIVRTRSVAEGAIEALHDLDVEFYAATTVEEANEIVDQVTPDHVIFGGGLALDSRLLIIRHVYETSNSTTVHLNSPSGPETYLPFVRALLGGLLSGAGVHR